MYKYNYQNQIKITKRSIEINNWITKSLKAKNNI